MAQKVKQTKVKNVATSSVSKRETSNALKIVAGLLLLFFVGVLGGVVFYYVTYGDLPILTDSSAGRDRCTDLGLKKPNANCKCDRDKTTKVWEWVCTNQIKKQLVNTSRTSPYPKVCTYSYCTCTNAKVYKKSDNSLVFSYDGNTNTSTCTTFNVYAKGRTSSEYSIKGTCKMAKNIRYTVKNSEAEVNLQRQLKSKGIQPSNLKCVTSKVTGSK